VPASNRKLGKVMKEGKIRQRKYHLTKTRNKQSEKSFIKDVAELKKKDSPH